MKRLIGFTAALCLLAIMVGCGGVTSTGTLAYISNSTGTGFTVYTVNTDGTLTRSSISPLNMPAAPKRLQFSPNGKWAYFLDDGGTNIYAYTRTGNGKLDVKIDNYPVAPGGGASSLVVSANSNFLYVALPGTKELAIYSIDQTTGILTQVGSNILLGYDIQQLVLAPNGTVLFGLSNGGAAVLSFTLTASTGVATQTGIKAVGESPSYMTLSSNGSYLYVTDYLSTSPVAGTSPVKNTPNIFGFTVGSAGALTAMPDSPFTENPDTDGNYPSVPVAGVTTSDNRYLFIANQGTHNISSFKINSTTGELQEVLGSTTVINGIAVTSASPFDCECSSPSFAIIPSGNNALFVLDPKANTGAGAIFQFRIDQNTGKLRKQSPASVSAEGTPQWITIR